MGDISAIFFSKFYVYPQYRKCYRCTKMHRKYAHLTIVVESHSWHPMAHRQYVICLPQFDSLFHFFEAKHLFYRRNYVNITWKSSSTFCHITILPKKILWKKGNILLTLKNLHFKILIECKFFNVSSLFNFFIKYFSLQL